MSTFQFIDGSPWSQQNQLNFEENFSLGPWEYVTAPWGDDYSGYSAAEFITNGWVYLIRRSTYTSYKAPIDSNGVIGTWTTTTSLPGAMEYISAILTKGKVHLFGYNTGNLYYSADVNADGTLGTWSSPGSVPWSSAVGASMVVTKDRVYAVAVGTVTIYSCPINQDGTLGTWTTHASALPHYRYSAGCAVVGNRVYIIGGAGASHLEGGVYKSCYSSLLWAEFGEDGVLGAWTETTTNPLPYPWYNFKTVATAGSVYLFGGDDGGTLLPPTILRGTINPADNTISNWTDIGPYPAEHVDCPVVVTSSRVYLFDTYWQVYPRRAYYAPFSGGYNNYLPYSYVEIPPPGFYIPRARVGAKEFVAYTGDGQFTIPKVVMGAGGDYSVTGTGRFTFPNVQIRAIGYPNWYGVGHTTLRLPDIRGKEAGRGKFSIPKAIVSGQASAPYIATGMFRPPKPTIHGTGSFIHSQTSLAAQFTLRKARVQAHGEASNVSASADFSLPKPRVHGTGGPSPLQLSASFDIPIPRISAKGWFDETRPILSFETEEQSAQIAPGSELDSILQFNRY